MAEGGNEELWSEANPSDHSNNPITKEKRSSWHPQPHIRPPAQSRLGIFTERRCFQLDKSVKLFDYGTGWDIVMMEMKTSLRLKLVRGHVVIWEWPTKKRVQIYPKFQLRRGKNTPACHVEMRHGGKYEFPARIPAESRSCGNQPHTLYSNLQLDHLFDVIHIEKPTSLSLEYLFSLIRYKHSLRKNIPKSSL